VVTRLQGQGEGVQRLDIATSLFDALNAEHVDYVHWKSNEHLGAAVGGQTDLDLLISSDSRSHFAAIVERLGFVEIRSRKGRSIPGLTGYLGHDPGSGVLLHLDVYYRLVLGQRPIKNYHLPVEEWLLTDADELDGVRVPAASRELVLLYVRAMLKTSPRQLLQARRQGHSPLPERIIREASWLAGRVEPTELQVVTSAGLGITAEELIEFRSRSLEGLLDWRYVADRKSSLRHRLRRYERLPRSAALLRRLTLRLRSSRPMRRIGLGLGSRRLAGPAPMIAVVGADGAGKTRLTRDLTDWLGEKLVVHHAYFGQPKTVSLFRLLSKWGRLARHSTIDSHTSPPLPRRVLLRISEYGDDAKWVALGRRRRRLAAQSRAAARAGEVVVAERFPLDEFRSMTNPMDGPRLGWSRGSSHGLLARIESRQYESIERPDLVLALKADIDTLRERKVDLSLEEHLAKVRAVEAFVSASGTAEVIDACKPYDEVLTEARSAVWGILRAGR
jgi:thymidylate kinase